MAKPAAGAVTPDKLELYEKLVATNPNVQRKGATVPYTSLNGHMFSYLSKEGKLELRLPAEAREAFLKKYKARLCQAFGLARTPERRVAARRPGSPASAAPLSAPSLPRL